MTIMATMKTGIAITLAIATSTFIAVAQADKPAAQAEAEEAKPVAAAKEGVTTRGLPLAVV